MKNLNLIEYNQVIEEIKNIESHLLLANGFNRGLGVDLGYEAIFNKMKEVSNEYENLTIRNGNYDIEAIIGKLKGQIAADSPDEHFIGNFINNKIKSDFMKAAYALAKDGIKNLYKKENQDIGLLFKNFTNFFTLNYDPFLYLLLMKYKKAEETRALTFQNSLKFKIDDINIKEEDAYKKIKTIYYSYSKELVDEKGNKVIHKPLSILSKTDFEKQLKEICKERNIKFRKEHLDLLYEELKADETKLILNDGFTSGHLFEIKPQIDKYIQNVFFLHGAFHIYKDGKSIYKITKTQDKALYERLEEIVDSKSQDIVCVFSDKNKLDEINENKYLKYSLDKLLTLKGAVVIIGSSLDKNDNHIFQNINKSKVSKIYYSSSLSSMDTHNEKLKELFPSKEIILFDRYTISYSSNHR